MRQKHPHQHSISLSFAIARRISIRVAATLLLLPAALQSVAAYAAAPAPTRTTLAATPVATASGNSATLIASVKTTAGSNVDTGTVDFLLPDGQSLGSAIVSADGTATLAVAKLPVGTTKNIAGADELGVTASYHANASSGTFDDSVSTPTAVATPAATTQVPDFVVTGNPTTVTTAQGSYATTAITVTSVGGYTGAMQLSCSTSQLPAQVTCAFNPTQQVLAANGSFVSTLQLQTQSASGTASSAIFVHRNVALAMVIPGALVLFGLGGRRRRDFRGAQMLGVLLLLGGMGLGLSGCSQRYGYLHHPPPVSGGTPTGTFPILIAVDGGQGESVVEHDVTVSLVVQ